MYSGYSCSIALGLRPVAGPALGQAIDPNVIREEDRWKNSRRKIVILNDIPMASRRAKALLQEYLVALGELTAVSEPDDNVLAPRLVI